MKTGRSSAAQKGRDQTPTLFLFVSGILCLLVAALACVCAYSTTKRNGNVLRTVPIRNMSQQPVGSLPTYTINHNKQRQTKLPRATRRDNGGVVRSCVHDGY